MALKIVGSSPIIHPIKIEPSVRMVLFLWNPADNGTRKGGRGEAEVKKCPVGTFFSPWESPWFSECSPQDCGQKTITIAAGLFDVQTPSFVLNPA